MRPGHAAVPQVVLDTVELVLSAAEPSPAPTPTPSAATLDALASDPSIAAEEEAAATAGGGGGSWLGSTLQSMALRAGLNVTGAQRLQAPLVVLPASMLHVPAVACVWPPLATPA